MSEPQSEIQLLAEDVLALAHAVRNAPPPVINVTCDHEATDHPINVTVIERERDEPAPVVTVPVTVQPAVPTVTYQEAPEPPEREIVRWDISRSDEYPYKMTGLIPVYAEE